LGKMVTDHPQRLEPVTARLTKPTPFGTAFHSSSGSLFSVVFDINNGSPSQQPTWS
jgi:hypothetical protein